MLKRHIALILAASGLSLAAVAGEFSATPGHGVGFGPPVSNDPTLNANLGVLTERIAWLNSPQGDAYQLAQAKSSNAGFVEVAQMSTGSAAQGYFPRVSDDASLNRANGIISQLIAWQNSSQGDVFMVAQTEPLVTGHDFERVAMASIQ